MITATNIAIAGLDFNARFEYYVSMVILILIYLLAIAADYWLRFINLRHLKMHGAEVPAGFEGTIDAGILARTTAYTLEQSRVGLLQSIIDNFLLIVFMFGGVLGLYDHFISSLPYSFVISGLLFFLLLTLAEIILDIPFNYYQTFHVENRYGFNTMTTQLWLTDQLKSLVISVLLMSMAVAAAFALIRWSPGLWWLWVWGFFLAITIFLMYISPYIIEPLFFKFSSIEEKGLEEEIRSLMEKAGVKISRVMQVDASRRSLHSNAYFTGIGKVKRIVLFDTILTQMDHREILSILAHEVGHWKKGHVLKRLIMTEAGGLLACYLAFRLLQWGGLPGLVGLAHSSFPAQLVILMFLGSLIAFPLTPFLSWFSRWHEWQADQFACNLTGTPDALASALIKLSKENLANVHPHPLYAKFYYSHPPVVQRVQRLFGKVREDEPARIS